MDKQISFKQAGKKLVLGIVTISAVTLGMMAASQVSANASTGQSNVRTGQVVSENQSTVTLKIQLGDTVSDYAVKYNSTVKGIADANHLSDANWILAGNEIKIPKNTRKAGESIYAGWNQAAQGNGTVAAQPVATQAMLEPASATPAATTSATPATTSATPAQSATPTASAPAAQAPATTPATSSNASQPEVSYNSDNTTPAQPEVVTNSGNYTAPAQTGNTDVPSNQGTSAPAPQPQPSQPAPSQGQGSQSGQHYTVTDQENGRQSHATVQGNTDTVKNDDGAGISIGL